MTFPEDPTTTLAEAQFWLRRGVVGDGVECPCCNQFAKVYRRSISGSMALVLCLLEKHTRGYDGFIHVPRFLQRANVGAAIRGGDWAKLAYWRLLEQDVDEREDGSSRVGLWRTTPLGIAFARYQAVVPKYVWTYAGRVLEERTTEERISVKDALGTQFNYAELMKA